MPTEDAYSSGHLVLSHFGTCMCYNIKTNLSWTCLVSGLLIFEHPSVLFSVLLSHFHISPPPQILYNVYIEHNNAWSTNQASVNLVIVLGRSWFRRIRNHRSTCRVVWSDCFDNLCKHGKHASIINITLIRIDLHIKIQKSFFTWM